MKFSEVVIVGRGKLAQALIEGLRLPEGQRIWAWEDFYRAAMGKTGAKVIVVHAGSGRELSAIIDFCEKSKSVLVEMATGTKESFKACQFPILICPNTSVIVLKFMIMLLRSGRLFANYQVGITESHQATKTTIAGTAHEIALALGQKTKDIVSVRNPEEQKNKVGIPEQFLEKHAYHKITIEDGDSSVSFETKVLGHRPYVSGLQEIIELLGNHDLEPKSYELVEFLSNSLASKPVAL